MYVLAIAALSFALRAPPAFAGKSRSLPIVPACGCDGSGSQTMLRHAKRDRRGRKVRQGGELDPGLSRRWKPGRPL